MWIQLLSCWFWVFFWGGGVRIFWLVNFEALWGSLGPIWRLVSPGFYSSTRIFPAQNLSLFLRTPRCVQDGHVLSASFLHCPLSRNDWGSPTAQQGRKPTTLCLHGKCSLGLKSLLWCTGVSGEKKKAHALGCLFMLGNHRAFLTGGPGIVCMNHHFSHFSGSTSSPRSAQHCGQGVSVGAPQDKHTWNPMLGQLHWTGLQPVTDLIFHLTLIKL